MDPVGLALAGTQVFSTCLQFFQLVQLGQSFQTDCKDFETTLVLLHMRYTVWSGAIGLLDDSEPSQVFEDPAIVANIQLVLDRIGDMFKDANRLKERYGVRSDSVSLENTGETLVVPTARRSISRRFKLQFLRRYISSIRNKTRSAGLTTKWVVTDYDKFSTLLQRLEGFISNLETITKYMGIPERGRQIITYELETVSDVGLLHDLEQAGSDHSSCISELVSLRLAELSQNKTHPHGHTIPLITISPPSLDAGLDERRTWNAIVFNSLGAELSADLADVGSWTAEYDPFLNSNPCDLGPGYISSLLEGAEYYVRILQTLVLAENISLLSRLPSNTSNTSISIHQEYFERSENLLAAIGTHMRTLRSVFFTLKSSKQSVALLEKTSVEMAACLLRSMCTSLRTMTSLHDWSYHSQSCRVWADDPTSFSCQCRTSSDRVERNELAANSLNTQWEQLNMETAGLEKCAQEISEQPS